MSALVSPVDVTKQIRTMEILGRSIKCNSSIPANIFYYSKDVNNIFKSNLKILNTYAEGTDTSVSNSSLSNLLFILIVLSFGLEFAPVDLLVKFLRKIYQ